MTDDTKNHTNGMKRRRDNNNNNNNNKNNNNDCVGEINDAVVNKELLPEELQDVDFTKRISWRKVEETRRDNSWMRMMSFLTDQAFC